MKVLEIVRHCQVQLKVQLQKLQICLCFVMTDKTDPRKYVKIFSVKHLLYIFIFREISVIHLYYFHSGISFRQQ